MRAKGPGYKKPWAVGVKTTLAGCPSMCLQRVISGSEEKIDPKLTLPGRRRRRRRKIQRRSPMTPEDCDPVVREVVEDTRAAVEEMMKELNDMVETQRHLNSP